MDLRARANALWAMGEIDANAASCIPTLIQALGDSDNWTRLSAARALGRFRTNAQVALSALKQLTNVSTFLGSAMEFQVFLQARSAV